MQITRSGRVRLGFPAALLVAMAGCSGVPPTPAPTPAANQAQVSFQMHWPAPAPKGHGLGTDYLPVTALSIAVSINGDPPQVLNSPATTLPLVAPIGLDSFEFELFDESNGVGNLLGHARVSQEIELDKANMISATLNGVIATIQLSLANTKPNAGSPASLAVTVNGLDADNNIIVGPGNYSSPIVLSLDFPNPASSGTLTVSPSVVAAPGTAVALQYTGGTLSSANLVASSTGVASVAVTVAPTPVVMQFMVPTAANRPQWITAGSDGNMWFTEQPGNAVARITPAGVVTEFPVPTAASNPQGIIGASDGNLWFTEFAGSKITRLTTAGAFTEFSTLFASDGPMLLVDRLDGNVWFVGNTGNHLGFQGVTTGVSGETTIPTANSKPFGVATGPDDGIYFTENAVDKIGRIDMLFGTITEITLTTGTAPMQIVRGPDNQLWFTEFGRSRIGRLFVTPGGGFFVDAEFPTPTPSANPTGITVGADGALWFTESGLDQIGRITTSGVITEYKTVAGAGLKGIASAPDGSLWFAESGTGLNPGRIGRLVY